VYAVSYDGVYRKKNEVRWIRRSEGLPADRAFFCIILDPSNPATIYVAGEGAVYKSIDSALHWFRATDGIPNTHTVLGLAVDPFDSAHLFAWGALWIWESTTGGAVWQQWPGLRQSPAIAFDPSERGRVYLHDPSGVSLSEDGGRTWSALSSAEGAVDGTALAVAPGGNTLYAAGPRGGVWTWTWNVPRRRAAGH
jgi:hypothetical protein